VLDRLGGYLRPATATPDADVPLGARPVFSTPERWALLAAFALIVMLRLPNAWVQGRFQDEEATVFLAYAWHHSWIDALFRSFAGYWNLGATATTALVAGLVKNGVLPLDRAPYLTMVMALAVQLLPAVLILTGKAQWLGSRVAVITALLMIATMPATEEVFFNVMHIQYHLALCVGLILALDVPERPIVRVGYGALLFLAPLCGPGAIVFLPLFVLRGLLDRDAGRLTQLAALAAGSAVQLLLFYGSNPVRGHAVDPTSIPAVMFVRLIALPTVGIEFANGTANAIIASRIAGGALVWWSGAAAMLLLAALIALAAARRDAALWLVLSSVSIAAVSFGVGIATPNRVIAFNVLAGERYNFLPLVLLGFAFVVLAMRTRFKPSIYAGLCVLMLLNGAYYYRIPLDDFADGPSWPAEVRAWRADHHHPLAVWPRPWTADLSDEVHTCSPPGPNLAQSTDPRYCESGWIAGFYRK
jgi:hypothetical protein